MRPIAYVYLFALFWETFLAAISNRPLLCTHQFVDLLG